MQSTPEPEAPVENNVAHDSTTESSADAIKVTPAVPSEVPASPPSAPAITEDVASVAKVISCQPDFVLYTLLSLVNVINTQYMMIANRSFARVSANDSETINAV